MARPVAAVSLAVPPKGRPYWLPTLAAPFELSYLSWGYRWYGDAPIKPSRHEGWHYFVVLEGSPILQIRGRATQPGPGVLTICHPDCPIGHSDAPGRRCNMLTWIWRTPPAHSALRPKPAGFVRINLDRDLLRRIKALHSQCREGVAHANERSMLQLRALRLQLDLALLEPREHRRAADSDFRINLAVEWLGNHLNELEPTSRLCEYLQISEASLKRLFHAHTGKSPRAFALDWRMRWAREHLADGKSSVKSIAYALGYRHPNDFSRAFKRYYGQKASAVTDLAGAPV